jgi:ABC transporter substrate binding protein
MRRREFSALLGSAAVAWPLAARAQQGERMRRVGVLMTTASDDPESHARLTPFVKGLKELGWTDSRNVQFDFRFGTDIATTRKHAAEMIALAPDVILAQGSAAAGSLLQVTHTLPIVFVIVPDPVVLPRSSGAPPSAPRIGCIAPIWRSRRRQPRCSTATPSPRPCCLSCASVATKGRKLCSRAQRTRAASRSHGTRTESPRPRRRQSFCAAHIFYCRAT